MSRRQREEPPKPSVREILAAPSLSSLRDEDPATCCNVCHLGSQKLGVWRERDEFDRPVDGHGALVFIGKDHPACLAIMERHPRLYAEEEGQPGWFPELCGPCRRRDGFRCLSPDLKANGGDGLSVMPSTIHVCTRPRSNSYTMRAWVECKGRDLRKPPPVDQAPAVVQKRCVYCKECRKIHEVTADDAECAPGAWVEEATSST